jgi:hypothetical protein
MGLFVDTTGTNVTITELGFTLTHPTTDYDLGGQFTSEEIKRALSLTTAIVGGTLNWKKTSGGAIEPAGDYDPDFLEVEEENLGTGNQDDRAVSFKDLTAGKIDIEEDDISVVPNADVLNFEGALVSVVDEGSGKATINVGVNTGAILVALFSSTANNVNNKFLDTENIASSENLPGVMSITASITKITFSGQGLSPSGTLELRVNTTVGPPALSINLSGTQTEVFSVNLPVAEADQVNCFVLGASGIQKPLVKAYV